MTRISSLTHYAFGLTSRAGPQLNSFCRRTLWCFESYSIMQSTMNVDGLQRQSSHDNCNVDNTLRKKAALWYRRSLRGSSDRRRQNTGSLPRGHKPKLTHTNSLVDYTDPQRTTVVLEKQDNETFGFEIQTYGLQLKNTSEVEMCTFVCNVKEDGVAESAGLTAGNPPTSLLPYRPYTSSHAQCYQSINGNIAYRMSAEHNHAHCLSGLHLLIAVFIFVVIGDVIITINAVSIEGLSHQHILDLIRQSTNNLKLETVCGNVVKKIELEKKLNQLQQSLREKLKEFQALTLQEKDLMRDNLNDSSLNLLMDSSSALGSPLYRRGRRFSSDSSYRSGMTDDSDQASVFDDLSSPSPYSSASTTDDGCFFSRDFPLQDGKRRMSSSSSVHHQTISRSSSSSLAGSSTSLSPSWDETRISSLFGTLPRKGRRTSVRKQIFKLIPGLQRSVEEEEMGTP
uniref:Cytohesin 1 interacting protein n=1 Tax=Fundulus heteroclitus TaxID=8078 RepID=A0A3Q2Q1C4_FUNHE